MEKVWEKKWIQIGPPEFKESIAYSDENVQEIGGNMGLKLRRERLKLGIISINMLAAKTWNEVVHGELKVEEKGKERVEWAGNQYLRWKEKERKQWQRRRYHNIKGNVVQMNRNRERSGQKQSKCCYSWIKAAFSFPISTDYRGDTEFSKF